jgi:hypothetical protein
MTTADPALLEPPLPPYRFYPTAGPGRETAEGRPRDLGLARRSGMGQPDHAPSRHGFPDRAPLPPLQQPVSALEGLHTTLKGTGAAKGGRAPA